jgi:uncharacterized membrane protein YcjF (UPF0283 family)
MAEQQEKVKIELEIPTDQLNIVSGETPSTGQQVAAQELKQKEHELQKKEAELNQKEEELKKDDAPVASFPADELVKAPLEAIKPKDTRPPNSHQKKMIFFGLALIAVGVILWPLFNFSMAIAVAIAGAGAIAFGSLVRV